MRSFLYSVAAVLMIVTLLSLFHVITVLGPMGEVLAGVGAFIAFVWGNWFGSSTDLNLDGAFEGFLGAEEGGHGFHNEEHSQVLVGEINDQGLDEIAPDTQTTMTFE